MRPYRYIVKMTGLFLLMTTFFLSSASFAGDRDDDWKKGHKDDKWSDFRMVQTERHKMIQGLLEITRNLVNIVENINHHPSASEKKDLKKMSRKLEKMIDKDNEISRKMAHKWKKKWKDD